MSKQMTAEEAREIQKDATAALKKIFQKHDGRDRRSITEVENGNYQIRKSDAEKAISKIHSTSNSRTAIAKRVAPATDNGAAAISALHSDAAFAGRSVSGNTALVQKLASAIGQAIKKDYANATEAKKAIKKLLATDDVPRPRNHRIVKTGTGKVGDLTLVHKKGVADGTYPYEILADNLYHSGYPDIENAERVFMILCAGA